MKRSLVGRGCRPRSSTGSEGGSESSVSRSTYAAPGTWPAACSARAGRPAEAVADVEDGDVGEPVAELVGRDQRSVGHDTHPAPARPGPAVTGSLLVAELHFFTGTMDSGKSTLALQTNHNHAARGRVGRIFTSHDRAGEAVLSSRLGLTARRARGAGRLRLLAVRRQHAHRGRAHRLPHLRRGAVLHAPRRSTSSPRSSTSSRSTCSPSGSSPTSASTLFPGSARLVELADRMNVLQVEALCWCGKRATHNARTENGVMVVEGEVVVVGDVDDRSTSRPPRWPTRCCAASTTAAGSPPPGPRRSAWRPSRCPSAEAATPQPTRTGMSISVDVSEPCRPTSDIS